MKVFALLFSLSFAIPLAAQPAADALFIEWGGAGGFFTLSYERTLGHVTPRLGVGYSFIGLHVPASVAYRLGSGQGRFEVGAGAVFVASTEDHEVASVWPMGTFGYRYDFTAAPVSLRAEFVPMWIPNDEFVPWVGLGAGIRLIR